MRRRWHGGGGGSWVGLIFSMLVIANMGQAERSPNFALPRWASEGTVGLEQFAGQVVVLDFFAYWCAPCLQSAPILEREIQQHYEQRGGNPQGIPVQVVSVNIDQSRPVQTERFIRRTGASLVVDDPGGVTLAAFRAEAIPFLVVIDARDLAQRTIIYRRAGFEGAEGLRSVIDAIGARTEGARTEGADPVEPSRGELSVSQELSVAAEGVWSSDIRLSETSLTYQQQAGAWQSRLGVSYQTYAEDYEPFAQFDALGFEEVLREQTYGGQAEFSYQVAEPWRVLVSGGAYSGFTDYRSVWLDNYYRQQFSFVPGYEEADPKGYNLGAGGRWQFWPNRGFLEARVSYLHSEVAPGYEVDVSGPMFRLLRGRDRLDTWSGYLGAETVVSARVRTLLEFQLSHTTDRETRYGVQGSWNLALWERGVWRCQAGYTREDPEFEAWFVSSTFEWELTPAWSFLMTGRYYSDTGEITDSRLLSTAAPGLEAWQFGAGLRFVAGRFSLKGVVGPYYSRYEKVDIGTRPFTNLYRDRDWILAQGAFEVQF